MNVSQAMIEELPAWAKGAKLLDPPGAGALDGAAQLGGVVAGTGLDAAVPIEQGADIAGAVQNAVGAGEAPPVQLEDIAQNLLDKPRPGITTRDAELEQMAKVKLLTSKSGIIVLGPAGMGKSSLVTEFAHRTNTNVWSLDAAKLIGDTGLRGQYEKRLDSIFEQMREKGKAGDILFLDEAQVLARIGGGKDSGSMSLLDHLKARTASEDLGFKVILATNEPDAFTRDEAVMRRLVKVDMQPGGRTELDQVGASLTRRYAAVHGTQLEPAQLGTVIDKLQRSVKPLTPAAIGNTIEPALADARVRRGLALEFWKTQHPAVYDAMEPIAVEHWTLAKLQQAYSLTEPGAERDGLADAVAASKAKVASLVAAANTAGIPTSAIDQVLHPLPGELDAAVAATIAGTKSTHSKLLDLVGGPEGPGYVRALAHKLIFEDPDVRRVIGRVSGPMSTDTRPLLENVVFRRLQDPALLDGLEPMSPDQVPAEDYEHVGTAVREAINNTLWPQRVSGLVSKPELGR